MHLETCPSGRYHLCSGSIHSIFLNLNKSMLCASGLLWKVPAGLCSICGRCLSHRHYITAVMYDKTLQSGSVFFQNPEIRTLNWAPQSATASRKMQHLSGTFPAHFQADVAVFAVHTNRVSSRISVFRGFCLKAEINFPWHEAVAAALDTYWSVVFANVACCPKKSTFSPDSYCSLCVYPV